MKYGTSNVILCILLLKRINNVKFSRKVRKGHEKSFLLPILLKPQLLYRGLDMLLTVALLKRRCKSQFLICVPIIKLSLRYDPKTSMDALVVVPISQAAATQRAGRAGRYIVFPHL